VQRVAGTAGAVRAYSEAGLSVRWGGHVEELRRRRGDAVGVKAGASLIDRFHGERGNHPRSPSPPGSQPGWWAGPLPTDGRGMGRRPRSSPSTREACTWRRGPASRQGGCWDARRSLVNTDESELALFRRSDEYGRFRPSCTVGPTTTHSGTCGAPVARKRARRVREAARGNPPVETPAGRPGPTSRLPNGPIPTQTSWRAAAAAAALAGDRQDDTDVRTPA
jgi:hypothetical protein